MPSRIATLLGACLAAAVLLAGCSDKGKDENDSIRVPAPVDTGSSVPPPPSSATSSTSLAPVGKVFDQQAVQDGVKKVLTQSYQLAKVGEVSCPANQPVKVGSTFDCSARIDGKQQQVPIKVQSEQGAYQVGQPG